MSGHGPDVDSWRKASEAELKPVKIEGTMAFMVESCWPYRPTQFALDARAARLRRGLGGFPQGESCRDQLDQPRSKLQKLGRRAPTGMRFSGPEPAARHLFGGANGAAAPASRSAIMILDLRGLAGLLDEDWREDLAHPAQRLARPRARRQRALRRRLSELLSDERYRDDVEPHLVGQARCGCTCPA